jgi:hypothetical protein
MKGVVLFVVLIAFILLSPVLLGSLIWPLGGGGGLAGTLTFLGMAGLAGLVNGFFAICIAMLLLTAVISAQGTFYVREHVRDMLPWAITVLSIAFLVGVLR